jgi:hypothetical protein
MIFLIIQKNMVEVYSVFTMLEKNYNKDSMISTIDIFSASAL